MADSINRAFGIVVLLFVTAVAYLKGFDSGYNEGMRAGQVRELINQGYTIEDAKDIADGRERMMTTISELLE